MTGAGGVVHVTYMSGEPDYVVDPDVRRFELCGSRSRTAQAGAAVVIIARKMPEEVLTAC